ncbi:MAG: hypothetical protein IJO68_07965 [Clostridia bacterium]|nr:hypothetical protein [Clostridia bacterium]
MNDNYENEVFEEGEELVENEGKKKNPEKIVKIILVAVIFALVAVVVLASLLLGSRSGNEETTVAPEESSTAVEITTSPAEKYTAGQYTVNVGANGNLRLRKDATKDAEILMDIPNGTLVTVTEVKYDETAEEGAQYWGKTVYLGWEGWVSMIYLANAYSGSIVTPGEQTTAPEGTTVAGEESTTSAPSTEQTTSAPVEQTTSAPVEQTTAASVPEQTTAANTAGSAYSTGKYTVDAQPHLNMRDGHSVNALSIAQIPDNSEITIVEVYFDASSTNNYTKYWGKTTYGGVTGWVAMGYLEK